MSPNGQAEGTVAPQRGVRRRGGFTLVEAMLALMILSIGVYALGEAMSKCLAVVRKSRQFQTARAVLDLGALSHPLRGTNEVDKNRVAPVELDGYPGFIFSRDLEPIEGEKHLYVVTTRVRWAKEGDDPLEEVTSYLYCPNADE